MESNIFMPLKISAACASCFNRLIGESVSMQRHHIFTRQFWRAFRVEIRRAPRDARARKSLLLRFAAFAYLIAVGIYYGEYAYSFHDPVTAIVMGVIFGSIVFIVALVRFSQWRESRRQLLIDIASVPVGTTALVQRLAHGLAAITQRALGERWLMHHVVPEGHSVITRRIQLETLRQHGVWDEMPTEVRAWMMSPDGSWPATRVAHVLSAGETLNTLLWALALQPSIRPVEDLLNTLSMDKFAKALQKPAKGIRRTWDIRLERNRALEYFWRCQSERVHRGQIEADNEDQASAMRKWMDEIDESPNKDYLAGASTIRELDDGALLAATRGAAHRMMTLSHLMELLDGLDVAEQLTRHVYVSMIASHDSEPETEPQVG
jgi:hypothetical protein